MKQWSRLLLAMCIMAAVLCVSVLAADNARFTDVATSDYFAKPVEWAVSKNITVGTGDGTTFSPGQTYTRTQILTFLWRAAEMPQVHGVFNQSVSGYR